MILGGFVVRAAHNDALAVAAGGRQADPVAVGWHLPSVAPRLKRSALVSHDVAFVENCLGRPPLDDRQLAWQTLRPRRAALAALARPATARSATDSGCPGRQNASGTVNLTLATSTFLCPIPLAWYTDTRDQPVDEKWLLAASVTPEDARHACARQIWIEGTARARQFR